MVIVTQEISDEILVVRLNRPNTLNALNAELLSEIADTIRTANGNYTVLIIEGEGDSFSSGADLNEVRSDGEVIKLFQDITRAVTQFEGIVVGKLHGWVIGGGFEWTLSFDLRYAREDTVFKMTESEIGVTISNASTLLMQLSVGAGRARELVYTSREVDALEARDLGLVSGVYDKEELDEKVRSVAEDIVENKSRAALVLNKRGFANAFPTQQALDYEELLSGLCEVETGRISR